MPVENLKDFEGYLLSCLDFVKAMKVLKSSSEDLEIETDMDTWNTLDLGEDSGFCALTENNSIEPRTPKFLSSKFEI
jgi:hypothetical protein